MYMYIVYCILYIDIGDEINNSIIYFVQTNYSSCCSYLKYHFPKYLIFNAHGINTGRETAREKMNFLNQNKYNSKTKM